MAETHLIDVTGRTVFRGTQKPPGGGSQPGAARWVGPLKINTFAGQQFEDQVAGSVTGGTFTASYGGHTTPALAWDVAAADLKAALEALASLGAGSVVSVTGANVNSGYVIQFTGLAVTALITADSSALTGPDSPYNVGGLGFTSALPLVSVVEGDILDELLWIAPTTFDTGATFDFADDPANPEASGPVWAPGFTYGPFPLDAGTADVFTTFQDLPTVTAPATLTQWMLTKWITDASLSPAYLPAIAKAAGTVYVVSNPGSPPAQGELWAWARIATPVAA